MISIVWDPGFKKLYQKKIKNDDNLKKRFWKTMKLFSSNPFSKQLRTHKLTGTL
jgi:mRNA-degrading endonuclease YafQ of YafQ-DinJ toxin-antitoxin module